MVEFGGWAKKEGSDGRRFANAPVSVGSISCSDDSDDSGGGLKRRDHRGPQSGVFNGLEMSSVVPRGRRWDEV